MSDGEAVRSEPRPDEPRVGEARVDEPWVGQPRLDDALVALRRAIEAAAALGLATPDARRVMADAGERRGLPVDSFILALAGGTGVGKSSLLNALAGREVSKVGVRRPTTGQPVAWMSRPEPGLERLLAWVEVPGAHPAEGNGRDTETARAGAGAVGAASSTSGSAAGAASLAPVAVLDLPDLDSIDEDHRRRVEELLPRIDAVVWVVDTEKYADALLHEDFLRRWSHRIGGGQILAVNKIDMVAPGARNSVVEDAVRLLRSEGVSMPVLASQAVAGPAGVAEIRRWLDALATDKAVATARLAASVREAVRELATAAAVDSREPRPLVSADSRRTAIAAVRERLLETAGVERLDELAVSATTTLAAETTGPIAPFRRAARAVGLGGGVRDAPRRHLERWRERGSLLRAAEPASAVLRGALLTAPPAVRRSLADVSQPLAIAGRLETVMDSMPASLGDEVSRTPTGRGWGTLGMLQAIALGAALVAGLWFVAGYFAQLPIRIDTAAAVGIVVVGALLGFALRFALRQYAALLGRRWARRLRAGVERSIDGGVGAALFEPIDLIEAQRTALAEALRTVDPAGR